MNPIDWPRASWIRYYEFRLFIALSLFFTNMVQSIFVIESVHDRFERYSKPLYLEQLNRISRFVLTGLMQPVGSIFRVLEIQVLFN